jgi:3-methyl-2-oxobutanoate hydroxymethyltransferase
LPIPIYGIGGGIHADGQVMIVSDIVGHFQAFTPKFVKRYGDVAGEITRSFEAYIKDVKQGDFPAQEHAYQMVEGELTKLQDALK